MKSGIHPVYKTVTVTCACGETFVTRSTRDDMRLEICAKCHPFFTGKQKLIDSAGRVERFQKRYKNVGTDAQPAKKAPAPTAAAPAARTTAAPAKGAGKTTKAKTAAASADKGSAAGGT